MVASRLSRIASFVILIGMAAAVAAQTTTSTIIAFPPVTLVSGQGARVNVVDMSPSAAVNPVACIGTVFFIDAAGSMFGDAQGFTLSGGQSTSLQALLPAIDPPGPGKFGSLLLRATVRLPSQPCHVRAVMETYANDTGATLVETPAR